MRNLVLQLETRRCLDGVELVRLDNAPEIGAPLYGAAGPDWFSWRSDRHERAVIRSAVDLANPLVVRFVNADDDEKRVDFLSLNGLSDAGVMPAVLADAGREAEPRNFVLGAQRELRRLLLDAGSGDATRAAKAAKRSLHTVGVGDRFSVQSDGRVALTVMSLVNFMRIEIATVQENGARAALCKRCGDVFLYGKATNRRSTATYCGVLCRVNAHRAKNRNHKGS
jgi:hypothetical protein